MQPYFNSVAKKSGPALSGVSVTVTNATTGALATIYSDNGVTTQTNPMTTDTNGRYGFYAADARYVLTFSGSNFTTFTETVLLEDPADGSAALAASTGSSLVGHIASGAGAVATTVQAKLRRLLINSGDYSTLVEALAASATNLVLDDSTGNLYARGRSVWGGSTGLAALPIRHQWFAKNSLGDWYEALAVDDNGLADGNVVVVIPKFLSMGRAGVAGFIEFGPDLGAEAIITGSGSPNFHLIQRVSKQANSGHKIGIHSTGGSWELARSSDNFAANNQILILLNATGIHEFRKHSGVTPTIRFIATDGTTVEGDIFHDGNLRLKSQVGGMILENTTQLYVGPNASTNPVLKVDNSVASAATGIAVTGRAAGAGVDLTTLSSAANENFRVAAKGTGFVDIITDGAAALRVNRTATAVNGVAVTPAAASGSPIVGARGDDTNIRLKVNGKGNLGAAVQGTATNDNADAGYVGEFITSTVAVGSAVALTNNTTANVTSISLTAGDWWVWAQADFALTGATSTHHKVGISLTSATLPSQAGGSGLGTDALASLPLATTALSDTLTMNVATRISLAATTTVYMVAEAAFSAGTDAAYGTISARRAR